MGEELERLIRDECDDHDTRSFLTRQACLFAKGFERGHERFTPGQLFRTPTTQELHETVQIIHDTLYGKNPMYLCGQVSAHIAQASSLIGIAYVVYQYLS